METLPATLSSEEELIRAIVANSDVLGDVASIVSEEDFLTPLRGAYRTLLNAWLDGETIDETTILALFEKAGVLEDIGGHSRILDLATGTPSAAEFHAREVHRNGSLWRLRLLSVGLQQRTNESGADPTEIQLWLDGEVTSNMEEEAGTVPEFSDAVAETLDWLEAEDNEPRLSTGFVDLDDIMNGGMAAGQMIVVAARPGRGKSVLAVDLCRHASLRLGKNVAFFSLEMSRRELILRILAAEMNIRLGTLVQHKMTEEDWGKVAEKTEDILEADFHIDDSPTMTMLDIKARTRQLNHKKKLDLVVIDYLQLLSSGRDIQDRQAEVSSISRDVKLLAKELECPIIAVAQLNREVEKRGDGAEPKLSDLRESGSLEQDADVVLMINRPDAEDMDHERAGEADFILVKQRGGRIGKVTVAHQLHYAKFANFQPPPIEYLVPNS